MRTVVLGPRPPELEALLERRQRLGLDRYDEVWEGDYVTAPAPNAAHGDVDRQLARLLFEPARRAGLVDTGPFNLGEQDDYRVPDAGYHRTRPRGVFVERAVIVVEIVSPSDRSYEKLDFYHARGVEEVLVVDPSARTVRWFERTPAGFEERDRSALLGGFDLAAVIDWPEG